MAEILDRRGNPALGRWLRRVRSVELQKDRESFRRALIRLGSFLAYEIAAGLESRAATVTTPLGQAGVVELAQPPVLATALRAGLPFLDGMLDVFPDADVMFFGAARAEGNGPAEDLSMDVKLDYEALVPCHGRDVIFADPMVATGSTVVDIHNVMTARHLTPRRFIVAGLVGFSGAVERIEAAVPSAEIWFVTCDEELNERGYIVPGLGDAGDLCYGEKLEGDA
ncbi:MAG TPA: uracil phosphoribosyltransferase [Planctomycetes bacterium]|nr:uracil phosphoribosyltransferase [Planctomycetota bacterium]